VASRAEAWLDALAREIETRARTTWGRPRLDTLFVGGGTPSALGPSQWRRLGRLLGDAFRLEPDLEFTSEANPESLDEETVAAMRVAGVNRLSLGAQSGDAAELARLGRIHGRGEVERAVALARRAGFTNLNLDLMYGLPEQETRTSSGASIGSSASGPST
jgi:oxygen-independent coproporphyrinogen-3 oxidase